MEWLTFILGNTNYVFQFVLEENTTHWILVDHFQQIPNLSYRFDQVIRTAG